MSKNLYQKLAEVVTAISHVEKRGTNTHQHYSYVRATDIANAVRGELSERNIYLVSDVAEARNYTIPAREGVMQAVDVRVLFTFIDGDSADRLSFQAWGTGTDKGDKAVYKAMTGALKYGLRNAFLIPDEMDPETENEVSTTAVQSAPLIAVPKVSTQPATQGVDTRPLQTLIEKAKQFPTLSPVIAGAGAFGQEPATTIMPTIVGVMQKNGTLASPQPTQEQLDNYKVRAAKIRTQLEDAGFQPSTGMTTGSKLVKYFVRLADVATPKDMTVAQWEAVFTVLDFEMKDPKKAVERIEETIK